LDSELECYNVYWSDNVQITAHCLQLTGVTFHCNGAARFK